MRARLARVFVVGAVALSLAASACGSNADSRRASTATTDRTVLTQTAPTRTVYATGAGEVTLACEGSGAVPVVLLAGGVDPVSTWDDVVQRMGPDVLVCRFDPLVPGPATTPITATNRSDGLAEALSASGLEGPYVFVGHSLAGLTLRQFGADHPGLVAAVLLLDPTIPRSVEGGGVDLAALHWDTAAATAEVLAPVSWPDVPVVVLSHDPNLLTLISPEVEQVWTDGQQGYAALSPQGRQEAVAGSGHYIYRDAPDQVVTALRQMVESVS